MARLASVAEKSLTGMETSPSETVSDAIDRAAISYLRRYRRNTGERIVIQRNFSGFGTFQGLLEALLAIQSLAPAIARFCQAVRGVSDAEIERMGASKLLPSQRHGHGRAGRPPRRVGDVQRLAANVHVVVHEDLSRPLRHAPFEGDVLRMQAHEVPADEFRHLARRIEADGPSNRQEDMQPGLAGSLHDRLERHAVQQLPP